MHSIKQYRACNVKVRIKEKLENIGKSINSIKKIEYNVQLNNSIYKRTTLQ